MNYCPSTEQIHICEISIFLFYSSDYDFLILPYDIGIGNEMNDVIGHDSGLGILGLSNSL